MPTKKHRYTITGDEQVEFALRRGRRRFPPGTPDSRILTSLVTKGDEALEREREAKADHEQRRRAAAAKRTARARATRRIAPVAHRRTVQSQAEVDYSR